MLILTENLFKIALKLTNIVTILANIAIAGDHIFKDWLNTPEYYHNTYEYCHNTCEYWAGEYTPNLKHCMYLYIFEQGYRWGFVSNDNTKNVEEDERKEPESQRVTTKIGSSGCRICESWIFPGLWGNIWGGKGTWFQMLD